MWHRLIRRAVLAFSARSRRHKGRSIVHFIEANGLRTGIFVGCGGGANPNERIVEDMVAAHVDVRLALDVFAPPSRTAWPFAIADGRQLPLPDKAIDLVLANAVIEHVGGEADQRRFVEEQTRVARAWVITTPNRWFPIESHTSTVLRHWSPAWRASRPEFTRLLSRSEFVGLLPAHARVVGHPWSPTFTAYHVDPATPPAGTPPDVAP